MLSPFPGMNPYFEDPDLWEDFHTRLATEISDQLSPHLRPRYIAALVPRVSYDEVAISEARSYLIKPDVSVVRVDDRPMGAEAQAHEKIMPAPLLALEESVTAYDVEIREIKSGMLVTVIEILSPVNKRLGHEAFETYQRMRRDMRRASVHLLEIDLLRGGSRVSMTTTLPDAPFFIFLRRSGSDATEIWPLRLQDPIPVLPVPLHSPDPDVPLDLDRAIQSIYERAAYDLRIDYGQPPPKPDLTAADAQWLDGQLRAAGLRPATAAA
jgi:Protein of unknown function (DUF4058)